MKLEILYYIIKYINTLKMYVIRQEVYIYIYVQSNVNIYNYI